MRSSSRITGRRMSVTGSTWRAVRVAGRWCASSSTPPVTRSASTGRRWRRERVDGCRDGGGVAGRRGMCGAAGGRLQVEWAGTCTCGAVPVRVLCRGAGVNGRFAAPAAELQLRQIDSLLEAAGLREGHHSTADAAPTPPPRRIWTGEPFDNPRDLLDDGLDGSMSRHPAGRGR